MRLIICHVFSVGLCYNVIRCKTWHHPRLHYIVIEMSNSYEHMSELLLFFLTLSVLKA